MSFNLRYKAMLSQLFYHKLISTMILVGVFFFLISLNSKVSTATESEQNTAEYQPKPGRKRTQARKPGGYRGELCNFDSQDYLTLIVPTNHIPLTTSSHPTFWWYVNSIKYPIKFTIYEPGQSTPLYTQELLIEEPSIISLKLPHHLSLEIGKQYRWTVAVICNQKRPSKNIYAKAWIERIENINTKSLKFQCLSNYAAEGIWYDALSCNSFNDIFWSLIEQVNLAQIVREKPKVIYLTDD